MGFFSDAWNTTMDFTVGAYLDLANPGTTNKYRKALTDAEFREAMARAQDSIARNEPEDETESPEARRQRQAVAKAAAIADGLEEMDSFMLRVGSHPKQQTNSIAKFLSGLFGEKFWEGVGSVQDFLDDLYGIGKVVLVVGAVGIGAVLLWQINKTIQIVRGRK